jgi:gluconate 2-dehydrogenase gamma chain
MIDRRTLIDTLLRGGLAFGLMPGFAEAAWSAVAGDSRPALAHLTGAQNEMISLIADTILPRSDTPSATDVGVPAWIDTVFGGYFSDIERRQFLAHLSAIDEFCVLTHGAHLTALQDDALNDVIASLDAAYAAPTQTPAQAGYVQLKEIIIVGYFTSKPLQTDVLHVVVVPGRFDPNVLIAPGST